MQRDEKSIVTVGTFDGVHRGHREIIHRMQALSAETGGRVVVVSFDPHPQIVLNKAGREPLKLLSSVSERLRLLAEAQVHTTVIVPFTFEFARTGAPSFIRDILYRYIGISTFFVGYDHTFGKDREGDESLLRELGTELSFSVEKVPPLMSGDHKISSTQIRTALKEQRIEGANAMLGYEYALDGVVVEGDGRGRRLGYPTANVECMEPYKLLPGKGVYFVSAVIDNVRKYGMANIGTRPTFTNDVEPRLEVHFFDYNGNLYNRRVNVSFHAFIRAEMKFDSIDIFWSQLREDREKCEELMQRRVQAS